MAITTNIDLNSCTVADLVRDDYRTASIFRRHGIDFCCGGKKPVSEALTERGLNPHEVWDELEAVMNEPARGTAIDVTSWPLPLLCHYIVDIHHSYIRRTLPALLQFSSKVAKVHGNSDPRLIELSRVIEEIDEELTEHLASEEKVLFPAISAQAKTGEQAAVIAEMESEHDRVGSLMAKARNLTDGFIPPDWACNTYRVMLSTLAEFESDLHRHVFLENHVLFPKWMEYRSYENN